MDGDSQTGARKSPNERNGKPQGGDGLTAVDFVAESRTSRFPQLIELANVWLKCNPDWQIKVCETVLFRNKDRSDLDRSPFIRSKRKVTVGLRLWIIPSDGLHAHQQQLGYVNHIPPVPPRQNGALHFEELGTVIASRLNDSFRSNPLPGKVLTVETLSISCSNDGACDPDRTIYVESGRFGCGLRIFFDIGVPSYETIGIVDFFPRHVLQPGDRPNDYHFRKTKYEPFPHLFGQVSQWCREQQQVRICNIQCLSSSMHGDTSHHFIRFLRLVYFNPMTSSNVPSPSPGLQNILTCKTFLPVQTTNGDPPIPPQFETLKQTLSRISQWTKAHGVRIVGAETCPIRIFTGTEGLEGPLATDVYPGPQRHFVRIVHLYLDGDYPDPPVEMRPIAYRGWSSRPVRSYTEVLPPLPPPDSQHSCVPRCSVA